MADIALLGTGRMGSAMASRLVEAGHRLTLWNRTSATAEALATRLGERARAADHPAAAVAGCEFVLSTLADGATTCAVLLDAAVLRSFADNVVVCDLATSGLDAALALEAGLAAAGRAFVDAPVSGSVPTVLSGQLLVMAGGNSADVDRLRPVLASFARKTVQVGSAGAGQAMKLSVNLVVHALNAAVSESLQLAEMVGISRDNAYDVLEESVVSAPFVKYKRAAFLDPQQPVAMSLDLVRKDLQLVSALAAGVGLAIPVSDSVAHCVALACDAGMGRLDMAALSRAATGAG